MATSTATRPSPNSPKAASRKSPKKPTQRESNPDSRKNKIANDVADRIINLLDAGDLPPWEKGWHNSKAGVPRNATTNRPYRGINRWLTVIAQQAAGYDDPRWLTAKQAIAAGGHINKGESATMIHLVKPWQPKRRETQEQPALPPTGNQDPEEEAEKKKKPRLWVWRTHLVFNVEQTGDCDLPPLETQDITAHHDPVEEAETIIASMPNPPEIRYYQLRNHAPHYIPARDLVEVPDKDRYDRVEDWYNTIFHELTHSTGHASRLGRFEDNVPAQDLHNYGKEELVAGMGSAMLGDLAGTGHLVIERDASYIKHWRDAIAADKTMVLEAALLAQKAVDYIAPQHHQLPQAQEQLS